MIPAELLSLPNLRNQRQLALAREQREETSRARQVDAQRALQKEMIKLQKEPLEGFRINLDDENILKWTAVIFGPPDTPYQGGYFKASLDFSRHPFWPPVIRFTPPIHHPNIHRGSGMLCYHLVRPPVQGSSGSIWNVRNLLLSFLALLVDPNPDDPANDEAAIQYRHYKEEGDPAYLNAIMANVAESRELAKRDNVIVPETNEDYTRSGIPTEQQQQSNQTEANVQEEEAQDHIAYPEDEWANDDDDNEEYDNYNDLGNARNRPIDQPQHRHDDNEEIIFDYLGNVWPRRAIPPPRYLDDDNEEHLYDNIPILANDHPQQQHDDGEEDGGLMTAVEGNAEEANSDDTFHDARSYAEESGSSSSSDTEDEQQPEGGPTIANRQASNTSVYLHDMPRPEPTIPDRQLSNDSVYL